VEASQLKSLKRKIKKVLPLLEKRYGVPHQKKTVDPMDVLIQTILSQNTNDQNRDRAYQGLKKRFPLLEDVLNGKTKAILSAIRPGGLAKQKAARIKDILKWIKKHRGKLSLDFLEKMDSEDIAALMGKLKGIGPKTVHCLLLFGLGRDAFPVDTHILRVGRRLGFIPKEINADKAHPWMASLIPRGKSLSLHLNLIRLGRSICKAQNPQCNICFLEKECLNLWGPSKDCYLKRK